MIRWSILGALAAGIGAPALAQGTPEEITVTGRFGEVPDSVKSLSQAVSYADLDLSKPADRDILKQRVSLTARFLCNKLGESDVAIPPVPLSCRDSATKDAMQRLGTIEGKFAPRGTTWVRPPAWQAPYPEAWMKK
jgi:UrcA family protein